MLKAFPFTTIQAPEKPKARIIFILYSHNSDKQALGNDTAHIAVEEPANIQHGVFTQGNRPEELSNLVKGTQHWEQQNWLSASEARIRFSPHIQIQEKTNVVEYKEKTKVWRANVIFSSCSYSKIIVLSFAEWVLRPVLRFLFGYIFSTGWLQVDHMSSCFLGSYFSVGSSSGKHRVCLWILHFAPSALNMSTVLHWAATWTIAYTSSSLVFQAMALCDFLASQLVGTLS